MNISNEYNIAKIVLVSSFVSFLIEIIIGNDVFVPVDWHAVVIPCFVYFLAVRNAMKTTFSGPKEERLFLVEIAKAYLLLSSGLSFIFHLRELFGPCGISHRTLLQTCSDVSRNSDPATLSRCRSFLRYVNSYFVDQNKCPWVALGNTLGSIFYAFLFIIRVGLAIVLPGFVHASRLDRQQFTAFDFRNVHATLYACGAFLIAICLLIETLSSVAVHYPLFNLDPCVFYVVGAYTFLAGQTDRSHCSSKKQIWYLCVGVTFLYSMLDFIRNYLLYHVSICSQTDEDVNVSSFCYNEDDINRCLQEIVKSSETFSRLFDCPINKLGPLKANIVKSCQLTRFSFVVVHQGLILSFGKSVDCDDDIANVNGGSKDIARGTDSDSGTAIGSSPTRSRSV